MNTKKRIKPSHSHGTSEPEIVEVCQEGPDTLSEYAPSPDGGRPHRVGSVTKGGVQALASRALVLPPPPHPEAQDTTTLFEDLLAFTERYVSWSREFRIGAVAFCLASWVYERFEFFPYLQLIGPPGTGKTRSLDIFKQIAYRPVSLASMTAAVIYRLVDRYSPTLLIDEIDQRVRSDVRDILRHGANRDGIVWRCQGEEFEPRPYRCFCPKVYAGQEPLSDAALESRIIRENMAQNVRAASVPTILTDAFEAEGRNLRSRLVRWKLDNYGLIQPEAPEGMSSERQAQVFTPLFTVCPPQYRPELLALAKRQRESAAASMRDTDDGLAVAVLHAHGSPEVVRPGDVAGWMNDERGFADMVSTGAFTAAKVGRILKRLGADPLGRDSQGSRYHVTPYLMAWLVKMYIPSSDVIGVSDAM